MFKFRLFDLVPIARDKIFEGMRESVIILDEQNRIADYNPAAQGVFPELSKECLGEHIRQAILQPEFCRECINSVSEFEIKIQIEQKVKYFYSRISFVTNRWGVTNGKAIVLSDVAEKILLMDLDYF